MGSILRAGRVSRQRPCQPDKVLASGARSHRAYFKVLYLAMPMVCLSQHSNENAAEYAAPVRLVQRLPMNHPILAIASQ
jgi:hypothetical protein